MCIQIKVRIISCVTSTPEILGLILIEAMCFLLSRRKAFNTNTANFTCLSRGDYLQMQSDL